MITIKHLSKTFTHDDGSKLQVLRDVNCEISKGEVISIIGPSGSGKSTLLRAINMMDPPTSGEIFFDGENVLAKGYRMNKLRQRMGMVFQNFNLFEHLNVLENVTLAPMRLLGVNRKDAEAEAYSLLRKVGVADKATALPSSLSGGQKQRVAIARCMAMHPEVILFDEPTSSLDPTMVREVLSVIQQLANEGMTILLATHRLTFARNLSTRIFFMYNGTIHEDGPPEQIFEHPVHSATKAFVQSIYKLWFQIDSPDFDMPDMYSQMSQFCYKYNLNDKIDTVNRIAEIMVENVMGRYRPLTVRLTYGEKENITALDFMVEGLATTPLKSRNINVAALEDVRSMSRNIIEEPTKRGFRVKIIV
jgi:ABC-type polar amino acid transport system ATPase subunit